MDERGSEDEDDVQFDAPCRQTGKTSREAVHSGDESTSKRTTKAKKTKRVLREEYGPLNITELLYRYPTCPPSAFMYIKEFFNNPNVNHIVNNDKFAERDVRNWCSKLNSWTFNDFKLYYEDDKVSPYFNSYNRLSSEVYYSIDESVDIAVKLLKYQFHNISENITIFLTDLYNILDKKVPKLNTLAILADPNAGKNFFFDAVSAFFINYGSIGTANKNNQFAFQEAAHKRIVLWNEPNYESVHVEKLKELLAGDTTRVHVKYQGDAPLQGPPIIILTNENLSIFGMDAFKSRIKLYRWHSCPMLKEYDKKINPLFLIKLLELYFII